MNIKYLIQSISVIAVTFTVTSGMAAMIEFRDGTNIIQDGLDSGIAYNGTHDAELRSNASDQNSNFDTGTGGGAGDAEFTVDAVDGGGQAQVVMRFDNIFGSGPGQIAYGSTIISASLFIDIDNTGADLSIYNLTSDFGAETSVSWNSFGGGIVPGTNAELTPVATANGNGNKLNIDLTASVASWSAGTLGNFGIGFISTGSNGVDFDSSENTDFADRPMLTVNYTPAPVPLPPSLLLSLPALGFLARCQIRTK